jgi:hypothetical protein
MHEDAEAMLRMEKHTMKESFEANKPQPNTFTAGQKVWLSSKDISTSHPVCKLAPRQLSPYKILERTGQLTY